MRQASGGPRSGLPEFDWDDGERRTQRALELDPNDPEANRIMGSRGGNRLLDFLLKVPKIENRACLHRWIFNQLRHVFGDNPRRKLESAHFVFEDFPIG
jgi:hypothetical protein